MEADHPPSGTYPYWDLHSYVPLPLPANITIIFLNTLDHAGDFLNMHLGNRVCRRSQDSRKEVEAGIFAHNVLIEPHYFLLLLSLLDIAPSFDNGEVWE